MNVTAIMNGESVTIVDITPTGNNTILVSYIDSANILQTTIVNFNPKTASTATIALSASAV